MTPAPKLKVYGLLWLTRRAYVTVQIVGVLIIVAIIAVGFCLPRPPVEPGAKLPPLAAAMLIMLDLLPWLGLLGLIYEGFETFVVLGKFKKLESSGAAAAPPPPSNP